MAVTRTVRADELDELLSLYQLLNPDDPELERDDQLSSQWQRMRHDDSLSIVVTEHDNQLVASCVLSITPNLTRGGRPFAVLENVVTHEDYRRNGFARRCVEKSIDIAEDQDCYKVMLLTGSDTEWKHEFYESCGFEKGPKTGFTLDLRGQRAQPALAGDGAQQGRRFHGGYGG
jgi:GNAT superfamily N-acetyltransferase